MGLLDAGAQFDSEYPTSTSINERETDSADVSPLEVSSPPEGFFAKFLDKVFKGDIKVALYALGLLIASTGNSIFFKKMTDKMVSREDMEEK